MSLIVSIIGLIILLLPVYYLARKVVAAIRKANYQANVDKWIDSALITLMNKFAKRKDEKFDKAAAIIAALIRLLILFTIWYLIVRQIPSVLKMV